MWRRRRKESGGAIARSTSGSHGRISFSLRQLLIFIAACAFAFGAWIWLTRWPSVTLSGAEIGEPYTIAVATSYDPVAVELRVYGNIDGQALLTDPSESTTVIGPGKVNLNYFADFYDREGTISYTPQTARSGVLTIQYDIVHLY
jgi:hypothetical protein